VEQPGPAASRAVAGPGCLGDAGQSRLRTPARPSGWRRPGDRV